MDSMLKSSPALTLGGKSTFNTFLLHSQNKRNGSAPPRDALFTPRPPPLQFLHCLDFFSLCISPSFQFKSDRCLSGTSEPWSGSDESHKPGPTARPQLLVCQRKLPHLEAHPGTGAAF